MLKKFTKLCILFEYSNNYCSQTFKKVNHFGGNAFKKGYTGNSITINKFLMNATNYDQLFYIFKKHKEVFSIINFSTYFKQFTSYPPRNLTIEEHSYVEESYNILCKKIKEINFKEEDARSLANLYHYLNKNKLGTDFEEELLEILEKNCLKMIQSMNDQEFSLIIYNLGKNHKISILNMLLTQIENRINSIEASKFPRFLYPLALASIYSEKVSLKLREYVTKVPSFVREIDSQDYSTIFFYTGKFHNSTIFKREFYSYLEKGKIHLREMNPEGLVNILHSLTLIEVQKMSPEFYEALELRVSSLLPLFNSRQLSLIFRGFGFFEQGSSNFFEKLSNTILHQTLTDEDAIIILYQIATFKMSNDFTKLLVRFKEQLARSSLNEIYPHHLEMLFFSLFNLKNFQSEFLDDLAKEKLSKLILAKIDVFSLKELGSICNMITILNTKNILEITSKIIEIVRNSRTVPALNDLKASAEIFFLVSQNVEGFINDKDFISKILKIALESSRIALKSDSEIEDLFYLRYYAKLIVSLSFSSLDDDLHETRDEIFSNIQDLIILNFKARNLIHNDILKETVLFNLIIGYYNINFKINEKFKSILKEAIKKLDFETTKSNNLVYLKSKTDLM